MQMMNAPDRETNGEFKSSSFSEGVSAMIITIHFPWLIALSGMLACLYTIFQVQRAAAVVPAYTTISPAALHF
jgi:hypothetical protein